MTDNSLESLHLRRIEGKNFSKKMPLSQEVRKSISMLIFTLLMIIVLLSITFLLNTSQSNQKGYIVQQEQFNQEQYELEKRELINKIIQAQSINAILNNPYVKKMTEPQNVTFIETTTPTAKKRK